MKNKILFAFLFLATTSVFAQSHTQFLSTFLYDQELDSLNHLEAYQKYDFSELWTSTPNYLVLGIIGSDHQRIKMKFLKVSPSQTLVSKYEVRGKSSVKGNVCDFTGTIEIEEIKTFNEIDFGVDGIYADSNIEAQGILIAHYRFQEDPRQFHSGIFEGKAYTRWYLKDGKIFYDDLQAFSDGYMNNAFIGSWSAYNSDKSKLCHWGDYRVPMANSDFDVGAAEFSPSKKYYDKGWRIYQQAQLYGNKEAQAQEWARWWE